MTEPRLAQERVVALYEAHAPGVRRFLLGVLKDGQQADDALQETFVQVMQEGHTAAAETMKGWIYKVAFHQAMAMRRRQRTGGAVLGELSRDPARPAFDFGPELRVSADEEVARAKAAVAALPALQREVVHLRIVETLTFAEIAERLRIPLGTALTRMRLALTRLRRQLGP